MNKLRIRLDNIFQYLLLYRLDDRLRLYLLVECVIIMIAMGIFVFNLVFLSNYYKSDVNQFRLITENREEISTLSANLFINEGKYIESKTQVRFIKLRLTGTGKVKGINKASIEDENGNYYYVREGDKVKGLRVKKISGQEAILVDPEGNILLLKLEQ